VLLNDYDNAIHWLEIAASTAPSDVDILYALGRCYYSKSRYADAEKMYERVLVLQPKNLKAEENLGLVYDATNRTQDAESALRAAAGWADPHGKDEWPFLDLGGFLLDHDRASEAVEPLRIAESIHPGSAAAHEKLGRALLATQDSKAGIGELENAEEIDPREPRIHYELGRALRQAGDTEQAKKEFALSQQLYSSHSEE
jgi:tetratricopeptide (TPR) repeat protein